VHKRRQYVWARHREALDDPAWSRPLHVADAPSEPGSLVIRPFALPPAASGKARAVAMSTVAKVRLCP